MNRNGDDINSWKRQPARFFRSPFLWLLVLGVFAAGALFAYQVLNGSIRLPNGYSLNEEWGTVAILRDPAGAVVTKTPIVHFMVQEESVYGVIGRDYFVLNTRDGKFEVFGEWSALVGHCKKNGIENVSQKTLMTYWDRTTGYKSPAWSISDK